MPWKINHNYYSISFLYVIFLFCVGLYFSPKIFAQKKDNFISLVDKVVKRQINPEIGREKLQNILWKYYQKPLNINKATYQQLSSLQILTAQQLNALYKHIQVQGALLSVYELQSIPHFDVDTIALFTPFISIREIDYHFAQKSYNQRMIGKNSSFTARYDRVLEKKRGFLPEIRQKKKSFFVGSPHQFSTKFRLYNPQDFSIAFAGKKNAGEKFSWDRNTACYGFYTNTFHVCLYEKKYLKTFVIGDYQVSYGQGLVNYGGFALDKSTEAIKVIRTNNLGVKPQTNCNRQYVLRGMATTFNWDNVECTTYYSRQYLDGKIDKDDNMLYTHNAIFLDHYKTPIRIHKKSKIKEQVVGNILIYKNDRKKYKIGYSTLYQWYPINIIPKRRLYNHYNFSGKSNYNHALFYNFFISNIHFFGEGGISQSKGKGLITGAVTSLWPTVDVTLLFHHYDKNFHNLYGKAFGANTRNQNEIGLYTGIKWRITSRYIIDAYYDFYYFPWYRYLSDDQPTRSTDWRIHAIYQFSRYSFTTLQYRAKTKIKNKKVDKKYKALLKPTGKQYNHTIAWKLQCVIKNFWHSKTQVQYTIYHFDVDHKHGYAAVQDIAYKRNKIKWGIHFSFFNTDSYDTRLYFYEQYTLGPPRFYRDKGIHYFLYCKYTIFSHCKLAFKVGRLQYIGKSPLKNKTLEAIDGNAKTSVMVQLGYKF